MSSSMSTAAELISVLKDIFGAYPGVRPSHAKGIFLKGVFTPSDHAKSLCIAPHLNNPSTPVIARFSLFTGIPELASTDKMGTPHGFAVRFILAETPSLVKTDIVSHATPYFVGSTGEEVLGFFQALKENTITEYIKSHPNAAPFYEEDRAIPKGFANEIFYSVNAFKLTGPDGRTKYVRYRWIPAADEKVLQETELRHKSPNFLFDELPEQLKQAPITFRLVAQIAEDGDKTDDCMEIWPEERELMDLGVLSLDGIVAKEELPTHHAAIVFDPSPGIVGIEASADPLIKVRSAVYSFSGRARRAASL